jgi:hypothetical protein
MYAHSDMKIKPILRQLRHRAQTGNLRWAFMTLSELAATIWFHCSDGPARIGRLDFWVVDQFESKALEAVH